MPVSSSTDALRNQHLSGKIRSGWRDVDLIRDPDGVIAIISRRVSGPPVHTIALYKVYEQDGAEQKTVFFGARKQGAAARRVLEIALARAEELETAAMLECGYDPTTGKAR